MKRLTLLVRADKTGLGYQTRAYYKHLKPNKTVIIDISNLNGAVQHYDWYENAHLVKGLPKHEDIERILHDTDVLLTAETPYNPDIYHIAKKRGIKTICVENPEFFDPFRYSDYPMPDVIILPSIWKEQEIRQYAEPRGTTVYQLHHPVDLDDFPFRQRTTHRTMHIAGKPAANDRNGTWDYMTACPDGIVATQSDELARHIRSRYRHSNVYTNINDPKTLYSLADILVFPRKYGGNCLPLNEALASGMPVIMPNIEPNYNLLPSEWLVPASIVDYFTPRGKVDIYQTDIGALRAKIVYMANQSIKDLSQQAYDIAKTISWQALLPEYERVIYE